MKKITTLMFESDCIAIYMQLKIQGRVTYALHRFKEPRLKFLRRRYVNFLDIYTGILPCELEQFNT